MSKVKVNQRRNGKFAAEREWAYDLIANSTGTTASEMADMMAEQFGHSKSSMSHSLHNMVAGGSLKIVGTTVRNGKRTHVLAAARRAKAKEAYPMIPAPGAETPPPTTNGSGVSVIVHTAMGPVTLTVEQAKALAEGLGSLFK
jgi:hypothetical protein